MIFFSLLNRIFANVELLDNLSLPNGNLDIKPTNRLIQVPLWNLYCVISKKVLSFLST